ncbi:Alpha beta hydrolase fold-3 [Fusarium albosuccineum]|uniref:Alpha beta hydrolase fold-3 n=1 Tax=Fusarium albosuccineum TaxID=1237068 RepID=A0A8H4L199_9HYPO|nr:Alpha beta hydrolase fold-3 [Fusarium albosuccineum]
MTGTSASSLAADQPSSSDLSPVAMAVRGREITGLDILKPTTDEITGGRVEELMQKMNQDQPTGGIDMAYGTKDSQRLCFWGTESPQAPLILFVHGGSWNAGTYLDSIGSAKVNHLTGQGYAFATVNYTLIPSITVEEQVQEVADSLSYLIDNAAELNIDPRQVVLMGHSSGAHVVTLLGTDSSYLECARVITDCVQAVISLDGSNYNAMAEILDSPGPVADSTIFGLGTDPERLRAMSPTYHAKAPNARAFLLLQVQRQGGVRQAIEFAAVLNTAGTDATLHVFEGQGFEGHMQMC